MKTQEIFPKNDSKILQKNQNTALGNEEIKLPLNKESTNTTVTASFAAKNNDYMVSEVLFKPQNIRSSSNIRGGMKPDRIIRKKKMIT